MRLTVGVGLIVGVISSLVVVHFVAAQQGFSLLVTEVAPSDTPTLLPAETLLAVTPSVEVTPTSLVTTPTSVVTPPMTVTEVSVDEVMTPAATVEVTQELPSVSVSATVPGATPEVPMVASPTLSLDSSMVMLTDTPPAASDTPAVVLTLLPSLIPVSTMTATLTPTVATTVDFRLMPTATVGIPMVFVPGRVVYQNHLPDSAGIRVYVLSERWVLLSIAATDASGLYRAALPVEEPYWLVLIAPLHRRYVRLMQPGEPLPDVILAGGDLNDDGCIGRIDIDLLMDDFQAPGARAMDITGDGLVDVADLAILAGNFDPLCEAALPVLTPEAMWTVTVEVTASETPLPEVEVLTLTPSGTLVATDAVTVTSGPVATEVPTESLVAGEAVVPAVTSLLTPTVEPTSVGAEATLDVSMTEVAPAG